MKTNYDGFRGWLKYISDYKNNKENDFIGENRLIEANKKIEELEKHINDFKILTNQKEDLMQLREKRIKQLNNKVSNLRRLNSKVLSDLANERQDNIALQAKLAEKEHSRKISAGANGGLRAKINQLQKELNKANYTIEFYKKHQKSPTLEELKAYEYQRKEVEKRQKQE